MPEGMAPKRVPAQQDDVDEQHQGPDPDTEMHGSGRRILEPQRLVDVAGQQDQEQQCQVQKVAMHVLQDEGEAALTPVALSRLAHGTGRRIGPKSFVVGPAVVIAGDAKPARCPEDQQGRRK